MLTVTFLDKVIPDIDFTDEAVYNKLQVMVIYKRSQVNFDVNFQRLSPLQNYSCHKVALYV